MATSAALALRRFFLGSLAAALGLTAATAPVVADVANAAPTDNLDTTSDFATQTMGTYESCTAYFGLVKDNSNLASFDVVNNTTDPTPAIDNSPQSGPTLVPVVSLTDASNHVIRCTPTIGWSDQASWESDYMRPSALAFLRATVPYPGLTYWLLPAIGTTTLYYWDEQTQFAYLPVSGTLQFEDNLGGVSVRSSMVNLPTTDPGFDANGDLTLASYESPNWATALSMVASAPSGNAAQAALLDSIANGFVNGPTMCDASGGLLVPDPNFGPLVATLEALVPGRTGVDCSLITYSGNWLVEAAIQLAKVANAPVTVTVGDPPTPPPTTTLAHNEPVTPTFTG